VRITVACAPGTALVDRLAALEARVAVLERQRAHAYARVHQDDDDRDLLQVIWEASEGCVFSAGELLVRTQQHDGLRRALAGATTPKLIGQRLRRLAGRDLGRLRLLRLDRRDAVGCIWFVEIHADAGRHTDDET
jgi:hypothetical protein